MKFDGNVWFTYLIYSLIAIVAFLGNAFVLYVLATRSSYLKTSCKIFICNLAITDLITSIMLIFSRYLYLPAMPDGYIGRKIYCKTIWSAWILFTLGYVSIYTCLALSIERWLAVTKPLAYRYIRPKRSVMAVVLVWMAGITVNVTTLFRVNYDETKKKCVWRPLKFGNEELPWLDFILQTVLPFSIIIVLYIHIIYVLRRRVVHHAIPGRLLTKVTKMTLAASCALIVGWLPSRISFMLSKFGYVNPGGVLHYFLVMFSLANSCVNPFLYNVCSPKFREDCKQMFSYLFLTCKKQKPLEPATNAVVIDTASVNITLENRSASSKWPKEENVNSK